MGCGVSRKFGSSHADFPISSICDADSSYGLESTRCEQNGRNNDDDEDTLGNGNISENSSPTGSENLGIPLWESEKLAGQTLCMDKPPFIPECELFEAGEADNAQRRFQACGCKDNFYPLNHSNYDNLPPQFQALISNDKEKFKTFCDRTVKLQVKYTSKNRPDTYPDSTAPYPYAKYKGSKRVGRCGTGFIYSQPSKVKGVRCPCPECANNQTGKPKKTYFEIKVSTAAHVIFDDSEASQTICEVFYDSEERDTVKVLYGIEGVTDSFGFVDGYDIGSYTERSGNDLFYLKCVSHDMASYKKFKSSFGFDRNFHTIATTMPLIISHPHGVNKQISFGTFRYFCLQLSPSHTTNTPYTIPVEKAIIRKSSTLGLEHPNFFQSVSGQRNSLERNTQPLRLFVRGGIVTGNKNEIVIETVENVPAAVYKLPCASTITDMDMTFECPEEDIYIFLDTFLEIFKDNLVSYHMIYDTPTCSGSSGAFVKAPIYTYRFFPHHFGKNTNGRNRTGDYSYTE